MTVRFLLVLLSFGLLPTTSSSADLKLLFMGDNGHHRPESRFHELADGLEGRGIELKYTNKMGDLNAKTLAKFDGLILYANIDRIEDEQAKAVLDFVSAGNGFVPLHCASYCWRNNKEMVALMGAQFQRHGAQVFSTEIANPNHRVMKGFGGFTSWDETYIHHLHNEQNRKVLEYRVEGVQADGKKKEPWTWVRMHGKGRVFYTAWGHDQRTFTNPGFHNLVERGIRWACGDDPAKVPAFRNPNRFVAPEITALPKDRKPFEYVDVGPKIPNYTAGNRWGVQGEPRTLMQKPLSPEESMKHFVTPRGMAVRLFADERHFQAKPIAMTWDERGRLWVCETVDYPNELGGNRDRIRICEDTDGDHVADRFTVFAKGLSIPTAIVIVRGGAVVQNGTETIFLKDTDGDDIADEKTTLLTGWALGDTHGGVSNFRYGLDNWIWAMQGYNNSAPRIDGKPTQSFRMGFWRFKLSNTDPPKVTDLEFVRSSDNNTWGLGISEEGLIFGSTANHNPSMFMPIPNRYYERVRGWAPSTLHSIADTYKFKPITDKVRQVDQFGGYTAGAGHSLYTARAFPSQWWNKTAFVCGPTGHLVGTFVLRRDGTNYTSTSPVNLLASDDEWSAPIMAEVGPDGAVWVIDWYNYIVQHNPTPQGFKTGKGNAYESDLRDKKHGRIYRVVARKENKDVVHPFSDLSQASNAELVETLKHDSFHWRLHAQRLLIERKADNVLQPLLALIADPSVDEIGLNVGAIHALHTLKALGNMTLDREKEYTRDVKSALLKALRHQSAGVRRNAIAVVPTNQLGLETFLGCNQLFDDSDAQVRLQAILKLADIPPVEMTNRTKNSNSWEDLLGAVIGSTLRELTNRTTDSVELDAITSAAGAHPTLFLNSFSFDKRVNLNAVEKRITTRIAEHIGRGRPDMKTLESLLVAVRFGSPSISDVILDGLTSGIPADFETKPTADLDALLKKVFSKVPASSKSKVLRLATQCGSRALDQQVQEIVDALGDVVANTKASDKDRIAAAKDLVSFRADDADVAASIVEQINAQTSPELAQQFLQTLRLSRSDKAGTSIVESFVSLTPKLKSEAISTLLSRPTWAIALLDGIEAGSVDLADLSLEQKASLRSFPEKGLQSRAMKLLAKSGGLPDANRDKVLKSLLHLTKKKGDTKLGEAMFKKHCAACHKHGEMGKTIGPNLTGMAVHPKAELLTHIIDPSRSVEGNFRNYTVVTSEGRVFNGMLAAETKTTITIIDSQAKQSNISRNEIDQLLASRKSVMPEGFEKQMTEAELSNLLEFLTDKGKFVPIPLDKYATAISTKALFHNNPDNGADRMIFPDWKPKVFKNIPFLLTDPNGKSKANIILLNGPNGTLPPKMPKSVTLPCNTPAKSIHLLSGVGGWSFPAHGSKTVSMIVRLNYDDGTTEEHRLMNGLHFADYIRRVDVPKSDFAFKLRGQQVRYLSVQPKREASIKTVELIKGNDPTSPIVMAVTIETP